MEQSKKQFKDLEMFLTVLIAVMLVLFVLYLIMAGSGQTVLKIICAILIFCINSFGIWLLHRTHELLRQRSVWMSLSFACCVICTLVSLLAAYPGP